MLRAVRKEQRLAAGKEAPAGYGGCGLTATASSARGFRFWTDTMHCASCGTLGDVLVEFAHGSTHPVTGGKSVYLL
jgi:hypothetical protein